MNKKQGFPILGVTHVDKLGYIGKMILQNPIVKERYNPLTTPAKARRWLRLARFAFIGESLCEYSFDKRKMEIRDDDIMASLVDLYIFYARSIYSGLMQDFRDIYGKDIPMDYDEKFIQNVKDKKYKISEYPELQRMIAEDRLDFLHLRDLRNAIKNAEVIGSIQRIDGNVYVSFTGKHKGQEVNIQEKLAEFVFGISFSIWILMTPDLHKIERKTKK